MKRKTKILLFVFIQLIIIKTLHAETVTVYALKAMPFCGVDEGKPVGIAVDILNRATELGAPHFEFNFDVPWIRATLRVQNSKDQLLAIIPFTRSNTREYKFKWVAEIMATEYRFYTYGQTSPIKSINEIKDKEIGVVHGHAIIPMLKTMGLKVDSGAKTAKKNAMKMLNKRFDILADSDVIALYSWKQIGQDTKELQSGPSIGDIKHVYIATGLSFPDDIARSIHTAIEKMRDTGELQTIYDKWL